MAAARLPGCTNGMWTVKLLLEAGISFPPFLFMKGEVWQLETGDASACWKCGKAGHIGDKCRQAVNILAESLASPAVGDQPSWAHVVKEGVSVVPHPPPSVILNPELFRNSVKATSEILVAVKAALKGVSKVADTDPRVTQVQAVDDVDKDAPEEHSYALVDTPSPAMDISVGDVVKENMSMQGNTSSNGESQIHQKKKAKLVGDFSHWITLYPALLTFTIISPDQEKSRMRLVRIQVIVVVRMVFIILICMG
jgi:hypothetical protein